MLVRRLHLYTATQSRAGFTPNRALFRKNVGAPWAPAGIFARGQRKSHSGVQGRSPGGSLGAKPPEADGILLKMTDIVFCIQAYTDIIYSMKNMKDFYCTILILQSFFFKGNTFGQFRYVGTLQKFCWSSCGGPIFVGGPCSAEHTEHA